MNCEDVQAALLAGESSSAINAHLEECVECRRSIVEIDSVRADLSSSSMWAQPPAGLEDAVVAAITGAEPIEGSGDTADGSASNADRRLGRRSLLVMVGSVAAAVVLVVGVLATVNTSPRPDWEAVMVGSDVTPLAVGTVAGWNTEMGTRVLLEAPDLGVAPNGFVYQLWFTSGSTNISAGTFSDATRVELTVGVSRKDYPAVWISLQPVADGPTIPGPALLYTPDT